MIDDHRKHVTADDWLALKQFRGEASETRSELRKRYGDAESGCRDEGLKVTIACDKCRMVIEAALSDESVGQSGSTIDSEHFCS